jgi:hypothetical protein
LCESAPSYFPRIDALINVLIARDPKLKDDLLAALDAERAANIDARAL